MYEGGDGARSKNQNQTKAKQTPQPTKQKQKSQKGGDVGRAKSDLGGTCHNDKPGLDDGDDGEVGLPQ